MEFLHHGSIASAQRTLHGLRIPTPVDRRRASPGPGEEGFPVVVILGGRQARGGQGEGTAKPAVFFQDVTTFWLERENLTPINLPENIHTPRQGPGGSVREQGTACERRDGKTGKDERQVRADRRRGGGRRREQAPQARRRDHRREQRGSEPGAPAERRRREGLLVDVGNCRMG